MTKTEELASKSNADDRERQRASFRSMEEADLNVIVGCDSKRDQ